MAIRAVKRGQIAELCEGSTKVTFFALAAEFNVGTASGARISVESVRVFAFGCKQWSSVSSSDVS